MQINSVWNFGDSWAAGHGVQSDQKYASQLAHKLGVPLIDYAESGSGMAQVLFTVLNKSPLFSAGDLLLVTIPPDVRWYRYTPDHDNTDFTTLSFGQKELYYDFLTSMNSKHPEFFGWHTGMYITYLINYCAQQGIHLLMQHNYGTLSDIPAVFDHQNYQNYLADAHTSMWEWLGIPAWDNNYDHQAGDGPPLYSELADSEYMLPGDNHPNALGHTLITEKLYEVLQQRMG